MKLTRVALFVTALLLTAGALAQSVTLSPKIGPPTSKIATSGDGFGHNEAVDIYFDLSDLALGVTNLSGSFSGVIITVPSSAFPGAHWVTAVGRRSGIAAQAAFTVQTNATEFHFTPNLKGVNPFENVLSRRTVGSLELRWSYHTGMLACGSPAVVNGVVYAGSWDGNMYALNATTGAKVWSYQTGFYVCASPTVVNGIVYFGGYNGILYALNASNGALVWSYATDSCGLFAGPTVVNGVLFQNTGCYGNFYAFDAATGRVKWLVNLDNADTGWTPAVWNGTVYVGNTAGYFYALDQNTGSIKWKNNVGGSLYLGAAAVANGIVYFGSSNRNFFAVNATTGAVLWIYVTSDDFLDDSAPAVANGVVYFGGSTGVYALLGSTGQLKWKYSTAFWGGPSVANGVVYAGSFHDNSMFALDAATGARLWSYAVGGISPNGIGGATIANGMVFATSNNDDTSGHIYAFGLSSATRAKWHTRRPKPKSLTPDFSLKPSVPDATELGFSNN